MVQFKLELADGIQPFPCVSPSWLAHQARCSIADFGIGPINSSIFAKVIDTLSCRQPQEIKQGDIFRPPQAASSAHA
jgi:hypothetical protein